MNFGYIFPLISVEEKGISVHLRCLKLPLLQFSPFQNPKQMSEVCGICFLQTESTVTCSVHQNSVCHGRELSYAEMHSLKCAKIRSLFPSVPHFNRTSTCQVWVRGSCCTRGRRRGGRNEEMTKGNEQSVFVQNTPDAFPAPRVSQDNDKERLLRATQRV